MLFSCSNDADKGNTIETVDLLTAYEGRHSIPISEVATELEYIQLESGKDHILRDPHIIDIKDSLILYVGFRQIYVFSRNTGKFLYEISGHGRGPEEYSGTDRVYNPNSGLFYVYLKDVRDGQKNLRKYGAYNIKGELIRYMDLPESNFARDSTFLVSNFWPMNNGNFIGYVVNITGKSPYKLAEFLQNGEIVKFHSNYNMIDSKDFFEPPMYGPSFSIFYQFSDSVRFYEQYTDTVFSITPDYLLPKFHLQMGDLLMPYKFKAKSFSYWNEEMKYFYLDSFRESSRFLFFTVGIDKYRYLVYYDKKQKSTQVCSTTENLEFYKYPDYYSIRCIGFENDIDDFVPIGTHQNLFIHGRDEFISIIPAIEVKDWFDKNPSKANSLDDKLKKFKDVSAEDNPLIVIAKLRK
jgi:hypothetical protein